LKQEGYDAVIDLHKNLRSMQVRRALRKPYFTFNKINWEKWLMVNLKINRLPKIHIVERYMEAVKSLGVKYDEKGLEPPTLKPPTPKGEYRFPHGNDNDGATTKSFDESTLDSIFGKIINGGKREFRGIVFGNKIC